MNRQQASEATTALSELEEAVPGIPWTAEAPDGTLVYRAEIDVMGDPFLVIKVEPYAKKWQALLYVEDRTQMVDIKITDISGDTPGAAARSLVKATSQIFADWLYTGEELPPGENQ